MLYIQYKGCPHNVAHLMAGVGRAGGAAVHHSPQLPDCHQPKRHSGAVPGAGTHFFFVKRKPLNILLMRYTSPNKGFGRGAAVGHGQRVRTVLSHHVRCSPYANGGRNQDGHRAACQIGVRARATGATAVECYSRVHCGRGMYMQVIGLYGTFLSALVRFSQKACKKNQSSILN